MHYFKKLVGERIYLSPKSCEEEDIIKFTEWMNDFEITDYIDNSSMSFSYESEKEWIIASAKKSSPGNFNIIDLETNELIGSVGLDKIKDVSRSAVLGIFIGSDKYRSNGYGTEAIKLLLEYGFKYLNLHSIKLTVLDVNVRAYKCYIKCGFKETGRDREAMYLNGKYHDVINMDILESEFTGDYIKNKNVK